jgi:hypothetical protein
LKLTVGLVLVASTVYAEPDLSGVLKLSSSGNRAHACPIAMDKALTNGHVTGNSSQWIWGVSDGEEAHGITRTDWTDGFRDLAQIVPDSAQRFPKWYSLAKSAPKVGDKVYFLGYDWRDKKRGYGERTFDGKVTRIQNGELIFDGQGQPGSSGSCILNEAGEVVAINRSGRDMDNGDKTGQGVGVWGDWLQLKPDPRPEEPVSYFGMRMR